MLKSLALLGVCLFLVGTGIRCVSPGPTEPVAPVPTGAPYSSLAEFIDAKMDEHIEMKQADLEDLVRSRR